MDTPPRGPRNRPPAASLLALDRPVLVGVVHLLPTPGAPRYGGEVGAVLERARSDALALAEGGVDALLVENFGDLPFFAGSVPPETIATMALALALVQSAVPSLPIGVNVLRNDARAALGLCAACGASFLRVNVHTGVAVTDQGWIEGRAAETLRERARLATAALLCADVHVKHGRPLADQPIGEAARDAHQRGLADVLIVSGVATGDAPALEDLRAVRQALPCAPLWIGSGLSAENAATLLPLVDGAIVGTSLKHEGRVDAPVDRARVERLARAFRAPLSA